MKGAPSPGDTIAFVNDQSPKRAHCRIIGNDLQNFEDMDALTAFGLVIDSAQSSMLSLQVCHKKLNHLLANLVQVMEEMQHARIELKNLIYGKFYKPLAPIL